MNESTQKTVTNYRRLLDGTDEIMSKWIDAARANPEPTDPAQVTSMVLSIRRAVDIRRILHAWENTPDPNEDEESDWDREDDKRINKLIGEALLQEALKRHKNDWGKVAEECEYMGPPEFTMEYALNFKHPYKPPYHFLPEDLCDLDDPECDDDCDDESLDSDPDEACDDESLDSDTTDHHYEDWSSEAATTNADYKNWPTTSSAIPIPPTTAGSDFRIPGVPPVPPIPPPQPSSLTFTLPKSISTTPATPPTPSTTPTESTPSTSSTPSTMSTTSTSSTPSTTTTPDPFPIPDNTPNPTNSTTPQYRAPPTS